MMGENIIPPTEELMDARYAKKPDGSDKWWRNVFENPTTVQFDHRALVSLCVQTWFVLVKLIAHRYRPQPPSSPSYLCRSWQLVPLSADIFPNEL